MRLLVAAPLYPPELGGPATYARLLEAELPKEGIEVEVLPFARVRGYPKLIRHLVYLKQVYTASKGADAVLALDPVSVGLPALIAARMRRTKFLVKVVGDYAWEQGTQRFGIRSTLDEFAFARAEHPVVATLRFVQSFVARMADVVVVPSRYLKRIVIGWGVGEERISVIYNAVEVSELGAVSELVSELPRPRIATAGRLVPWKGMGTVIDAMHALKEEGKTASLAIIGDGPEAKKLARYASVRLSGGYAFAGALSHADTLATIRDADIFVLDSTYEGLSHLLIEALSLGKAVIASKVGGNTELIEDGVNGLLIPPKEPAALSEALTRLMEDPSLAARLGTAATTTKERFSTKSLVRDTTALLNALV